MTANVSEPPLPEGGSVKAGGACPEQGRQFIATINGQVVRFEDPVPRGGQILEEAGFIPADEHVLIQLLDHETRSVGLDEPVDLRTAGKEKFQAFRSDRVLCFTLDGRGYEWGAAGITEAEIRGIAAVDEDKAIILLRDGEDVPLEEGARIDLGEAGTEHLRTTRRLVTVEFNGVEKGIPKGTYTTEQLIQILEVEPGYLLDIIDNGELILLKPGEKVHVKKGMRFSSQAPCGGSS